MIVRLTIWRSTVWPGIFVIVVIPGLMPSISLRSYYVSSSLFFSIDDFSIEALGANSSVWNLLLLEGATDSHSDLSLTVPAGSTCLLRKSGFECLGPLCQHRLSLIFRWPEDCNASVGSIRICNALVCPNSFDHTALLKSFRCLVRIRLLHVVLSGWSWIARTGQYQWSGLLQRIWYWIAEIKTWSWMLMLLIRCLLVSRARCN